MNIDKRYHTHMDGVRVCVWVHHLSLKQTSVPLCYCIVLAIDLPFHFFSSFYAPSSSSSLCLCFHYLICPENNVKRAWGSRDVCVLFKFIQTHTRTIHPLEYRMFIQRNMNEKKKKKKKTEKNLQFEWVFILCRKLCLSLHFRLFRYCVIRWTRLYLDV